MGLGETAQAMDKPFRREIRRGGEREHAGALTLQQALRPGGDAVEGVTHDLEIGAAGFGEGETLAFAGEQLQAERGSGTSPDDDGALVTLSSSAARVKLSWRAAASKALSALSGGNRRGIGRLHHEKNYNTLEERGLVRNATRQECLSYWRTIRCARPAAAGRATRNDPRAP